MTLNNNMVFLNLVIDAIGRLPWDFVYGLVTIFGIYAAILVIEFPILKIFSSVNKVSMIEKWYRGYGSAVMTLNNNTVFLNLVIDAMGRLWMLWYFNDIINLALIHLEVVINGYGV